MSINTLPELDRAADVSLEVLRLAFGDTLGRQIGVRLWDGTCIEAATTPAFTLHVNAPYALRVAFAPPLDLNPGRAFVNRLLDIDGDLEESLDIMAQALDRLPKRVLPTIFSRLLKLPKPPRLENGHARLPGFIHSRKRDAAAIGFHYDQPLAFYRSFLGERLVYSCAYFDDGIDTLDHAQLAKMDYILRKIRLRPGERLLDIGCGWGALVIRAAERFGARVLGITLSRTQYDEANRQIALAGIGNRARVELRDYRDLGTETFDKVVSVGMVEHVGRERLSEYFKAVSRSLAAGGLFLNHGIADQSHDRRGWRARGFIGRYVFPDGDLIPIADTLRYAERAGFEVRDLENLREHYMRTVRCWVSNLDRNADAAIAAAGATTHRIWRMYLAGSAQGFHRGRMGLFQALLAKPGIGGTVGLPATRRDLYGAR